MMPKKTTKTVKKQSPRPVARYLAAFLLIALVVAATAFIAYEFRREHRELGQYNVSDPFIGADTYKSLDLKVASRASFPSSAIRIYRDLPSAAGLRRQEFAFDVKDDHLTEYGLMLTPSSRKPAAGWPVVILLHGFMDAPSYETDESYLTEMVEYASHGFAVLKPDLRGQGLSINSGHADSAYYSMSYNTDVLSLVSAVKDTKGLDAHNINLWGHSLGAYLALRAGVISKDIKNIILLSTPADSLREMYLTYIPPSDENNPYALATRAEVFSRYGSPEENTRFWYDASPINFVGRIKAYVQIHVGTDDQVVPPRFSADLDAAFTRQGVRHQYFEYPGGGHALSAERPLIYERSLKLLQAQPNQAPVV